jgi:antitoxin PrlF
MFPTIVYILIPYLIMDVRITCKELVMATATVTTKGQITIPVAVRNALNLDAGSKVEFIETSSGEYKIVPINKSVQVLKGVLKKRDQPVTLDEMNEAVANMAIRSME